MALVNPNIAMSFRMPEFQAPNALAQYAQIQQIQGGRQAQELNALKMQEAQAAMQERNALRQLNPAAEDYENQLFRVNPQLGIQYRKEAATTAAQRAAQKASEFELKAKQRKFGEDLKRGLSANPSDENIIAFGQDALLQGLYPKDQVDATVSQLLALPAPERVRILSQAGASPSELKPTTSVAPTGIVQTPAFGGAATIVPGTSAAFQMTPAQIASNKIAQGQLGVSQGQLGVSQGQLSLAQQRLAQDAQGVTYQQDAQGNLVALPSRLAAGGAPVARPVTGEGGAPVKGKPSAFAEKAAAQRTQMGKDLDFAIKELGDITKDGGLIDQSTGSGAGRLFDIGAGFVGQATPGAIAIGKIAPVSDLALKMIPRFEGPQSDRDTASYKEAAGQLADPTLPTKIRKEAGKTVLRLMQQRKGQFATNDMAAEGVGPAAGAAGGVIDFGSLR
jgi:hypothetical protein